MTHGCGLVPAKQTLRSLVPLTGGNATASRAADSSDSSFISASAAAVMVLVQLWVGILTTSSKNEREGFKEHRWRAW